jgi:hypothetical protein
VPSDLIKKQLAVTLWSHLKSTHQYTQWAHCKKTHGFLSQFSHQFNHNLPSGCFEKNSQRTLNAVQICHELSMSPQRTHWVNYD